MGALTLGYDRVFTESVWIVLIVTLAGFFATHLGLAFAIGFAVGDFLVGQRQWTLDRFGITGNDLLAGLLRVRLPLLIGYAILAAVAVYLPRLARALIADIPRIERLPKEATFAVVGLLNLIVVAVAARLWAEASAVLVRPLFTWQFQQPVTRARPSPRFNNGRAGSSPRPSSRPSAASPCCGGSTPPQNGRHQCWPWSGRWRTGRAALLWWSSSGRSRARSRRQRLRRSGSRA